MTWTDNTSDESGFTIERATRVRGSITYDTIGQLASGQTVFNDPCGAGTFYYRVRAFKTGAVSGYSNAVTVRTKPTHEISNSILNAIISVIPSGI